jgi:hypothetical protein
MLHEASESDEARTLARVTQGLIGAVLLKAVKTKKPHMQETVLMEKGPGKDATSLRT